MLHLFSALIRRSKETNTILVNQLGLLAPPLLGHLHLPQTYLDELFKCERFFGIAHSSRSFTLNGDRAVSSGEGEGRAASRDRGKLA